MPEATDRFSILRRSQIHFGPDSRTKNLYPVWAGQSLKYAPLFGELIAELMIEQQILTTLCVSTNFDWAFWRQALDDFWQTGQTEAHSL